jgi:putative FmdB family regulatory protein
MPKYDFRCSSCETVFEAFRGFAQGTDDVVCPDDGAPATRLFSPPLEMIVYGGKSSESVSSIRPPGPGRSGPPHSHGGPGHIHGPGGHTHGPGGHTH